MLGKTNITALSEGAVATEVEDFRWVQMQAGVYGNFACSTYKNGYLAAITADGAVVYTKDGEVWQVSMPEYAGCKLNDIEWDGRRFLLAGSYTDESGEMRGLVLATEGFTEFEKIEISAGGIINEYVVIFFQDGRYVLVSSSGSVVFTDFASNTEKKVLPGRAGTADSILAAKNTNGMLVYKRSSVYDNYHQLFIVNNDTIQHVKSYEDADLARDIVAVFECKDAPYAMGLLSKINYSLDKVTAGNEVMTMCTGQNFMFVDGVYFNGCQIFINNHEMLVVRKNESLADKTTDDLIEIAPELTMNSITKAFGQIYIFGNQGVILKSSVETDNENAILVQALSAKKALAEAVAYVDEKLGNLDKLDSDTKKDLVSVINEVMAKYLPVAGGALKGDILVQKNEHVPGVYVQRTDTNVKASLQVGDGGTNHGIYSDTLNRWIAYADDKKVRINGGMALPRVLEGNADYKPGKGMFEVLELGPSSEGLPDNSWYHLLALQGTDANENYVTQLAVGMTTEKVYYRRMTTNGWGNWRRILFEGEALPLTGGTIESTSNPLLHIRRTLSQGDAILQLNPNNFANKGINVQASQPADTEKLTLKVFQVGLDTGSGVNCLLEISDGLKNIYDHKTGKMKEILVEGDTITPIVKETAFVTNNGDLVVEGVKGADRTDITEIFIKSNTYKEGMIVGVSSNGMGYIVSQNFTVDCRKLTDSERTLIQSFNAIRFSRANNSDDYPLLRPGTMNCEGGCGVTGKNGFARLTTKMQVGSTSGQNYFQYELPSEFRNDDNSLNNLSFTTTNWNVLTGINAKKRG